MDYWFSRRTVLCQTADGNVLRETVTGHHLALYRKGIDYESYFAESPQYSDFVYYFSGFSNVK